MSLKELIHNVRPVLTRFRCYKLNVAGSSFSYFADDKFTLIEAKFPINNALENEMRLCGVYRIDNLHITSWDQDHCDLNSLTRILEQFKPKKIEYPGYTPETSGAKACLKKIQEYEKEQKELKKSIKVISITPDYIKNLNPAEAYAYKNVLFHPKATWPKANDNSTVKFFRVGMFNVLSLGDVENEKIGATIKNSKKAKETDVLILPHHGASGGILTKDFLRTIKPQVAVCSSNYGNQYDHPCQEVKNLLYDMDIPLFTTKKSNILIKSLGNHVADFQVTRVNSENNEQNIPDKKVLFRSKKYNKLK